MKTCLPEFHTTENLPNVLQQTNIGRWLCSTDAGLSHRLIEKVFVTGVPIAGSSLDWGLNVGRPCNGE